ncbi:Prephenate and/or arogenate dehydrogenase [uncultured Candidatus Thioglobus sp.]|nr:Prephenate and/or arogenate dehydrogenase [uncultured Candidatus Thioglobus sp.]
MIDRICIIGVGLIGGSFAKGLKDAGQVKTIIGYGRNENSLKQAQKLGVIDEYSTDIAQALSEVDMVLIATPVDTFELILQSIKPHINDKTIISDVGSTKGSVIRIAKQVFAEMPENFIPAHPIAGKEQSGVLAANGALFNNKRVILTPTNNANTNSIVMVTKLWDALGAKVEIMDDKTHDDLLAMTSHLPHMLAFSLIDYLANHNPKAMNYAAGGFKDFSRIASSDAVMWRDICLNNADEIVKHIEGFQDSLSDLSQMIKSQKKHEMEQLFINAKNARDSIL